MKEGGRRGEEMESCSGFLSPPLLFCLFLSGGVLCLVMGQDL